MEAHLPPLVEANLDRIRYSDDVQRVAVMPDIHLGRLVNNGVVVATRHLVYPQAIGGDIGCGFSALRFHSSSEVITAKSVGPVLIRDFYQAVPALKKRGVATLPDKLNAHPLSDPTLRRQSERDGARQFGTLGCGNHFIELLADPANVLWLVAHSGSRAMGQIITEFHLRRAKESSTELMFLDKRTPEGEAYFRDMQWAVRYAALNRLAMLARVTEILGDRLDIEADEESYFDSPHNFGRMEQHFGEPLLVHRKSANSADEGEISLIAGTMGTPSFVVSGRGNPDSLRSSSHGAGRVMGRTEARQSIGLRDMQHQMQQVWHDPRRLNELRDEAPSAYRDIREVLRAQRDLTRQVSPLTPLLNFKYPDPRS